MGFNTEKYVDYVMRRVAILRQSKVEPFMVFDGVAVPLKAEEQADRRKDRQTQLDAGRRIMQEAEYSGLSHHEREAKYLLARECFAKAIRVTPKMTAAVMKALQKKGVKFVVAPYEADAQMAALIQDKHACAAITEDSDLMVYSVVTGLFFPVLYKMQFPEAVSQQLVIKDFASLPKQIDESVEYKPFTKNFVKQLRQFTPVMFVQTCLLAGCDYLPSLDGVGLITAQKLVLKYRWVNGYNFCEGPTAITAPLISVVSMA
jgi:exonuclease-1